MLVEGGGTLFVELFLLELADELTFSNVPKSFGGNSLKMVADGEGYFAKSGFGSETWIGGKIQ